MIIKLSRHVFGSHQGYRTLAASSDLTPDEAAELESFAFGQTNDEGYIASLTQEPAYWSRTLESGRRAITRVLPGPADDHGRKSLRFVSAVVHANDWLNTLRGEDISLLQSNQVWAWNGTARLPRLEVNVAKPPRVTPTDAQRQRILSLLGSIETSCASPTTSIVVDPRDLTADELAMLLALLPLWYRPQFSYGVRSLSEALPVHLNWLAPGASQGKSRRRIVRWTPAWTWQGATYTSGVDHFWRQGEPPPWTFVTNCKAFGPLQPTWEGTDSSAGAVAPVMTTTKLRAQRRRRRIRVPMWLTWVVAIALVVGTTGYFVNKTMQMHRDADATLAAAEEFLAAHVDPMALPSSGRKRTDLVEKAKSLNDRVAALQDASRAERQDAVKAELTSWLDRAGVRTETYESLDHLLTSFADYTESLGLKTPDRVASIPDVRTRDAVASWKQRLEERKDDAVDLGEPYPSRMEAALALIARWEIRVAGLVQRAKDALAELDAALSVSPPNVLSRAKLTAWEDSKSKLATVKGLLPEPVDTNAVEEDAGESDELLEPLMEGLRHVEALADEWSTAIESSQRLFQASLARATALIDKHKLAFDPFRAENLTEPWNVAEEASSELKQALQVWPDSPDALAQRAIVESWKTKASALAMKYFTDEVAHAGEIWSIERQRIRNISSNGVPKDVPNPGPALATLQRARDYWDKNWPTLRHNDPDVADTMRLSADVLYNELSAANDEYIAAMESKGKKQSTGGGAP